ncbi:hypothetical protein [Sinorhizobium meliloti]|uniref:hypothetical protein n=1 Tax=Rhizobium meliloti TaxID=382 RepID=UPI000FDB5790|nr:hypothetical protein [Sinorhizobium meliloti]RVE87078.1 hypothetical protein CN238_20165 [Sinorhizobium meliloti]
MAIFEVVTGQIRLDSRRRFFELHETFLLPAMKVVGIKPVVLLITEVGEYGRFLDIYEYIDFADYQRKTDALLANEGIEDYYESIGGCIHGNINISLMTELPYAQRWAGDV